MGAGPWRGCARRRPRGQGHREAYSRGLEWAHGIRPRVVERVREGAAPSILQESRHENPPELTSSHCPWCVWPWPSHRGHPESSANHRCSGRLHAWRCSCPRSASLLKERGPHIPQGGEGLSLAETFGERGRARKCFQSFQVSAIPLAGREILNRERILFGSDPKLKDGGRHPRNN